jgi:hypothetical protein
MRLAWANGSDAISLEFVTTVGASSFVIEATDASGKRKFASVEELGNA